MLQRLGKRIRAAMDVQKRTVRDLAAEVRMPYSNVQDVIQAKKPVSVKNLWRIKNALRLTTYDWFFVDDLASIEEPFSPDCPSCEGSGVATECEHLKVSK